MRRRRSTCRWRRSSVSGTTPGRGCWTPYPSRRGPRRRIDAMMEECSSQVVETVFDAALQRPKDERAGFLDAACNGNAALRNRVLRLLECFDGGAALEAPPTSLLEGERSPGPQAGAQVGPYELIQVLD